MIDAHSLIKRINEIDRNEYQPEALAAIEAWRGQIEELESIRVSGQNFVVRMLLEELQNEIKVIDQKLLNSRKKDGYTEFDRELDLERKLMYTKFVQRFDVTAQLEEMSKALDENL